MTASGSTLGSVPKHSFDISIGCMPFQFLFPEGPLLSAASRRYEAFVAQNRDPFIISLEDALSGNKESPEFTCEFEGAVLRSFGARSSFSAVRNEYALDSLLRMLLSWLLLGRAGFLLHAATIVREGRAYVFTGKSGAGKSTVASLALKGSVLTDEISLLRYEGGAWRAYGTPFWGEFRAAGANISAPVAGIFRLIQSAGNEVAPFTSMQLLRAILPNVLFFSHELAANSQLLDILGQAAAQVPGYDLKFRKERSFWEVLPA